MITFDTREPAPLSVRWARVIVPLLLCFAYLTFRLGPATHERISLSELLGSGVLFIGLTFVAFIALGDLCCPATPAERALENDPESTGVFARFVDGTRPGWGAFAGELASTDLQLMAEFDGPATHGRRLREIADSDLPTEELELLTHEYHPQHHTPARGFAVVGPVYAPAPPETASLERLAGRVPSPYLRSGEHDQFGQRTGGGRHRKVGA